MITRKQKKRKRKKWPAHKYWTEYLRQEKSLHRNGQGTISRTLAKILLDRTGEKYGRRKLDRFARYLDAGRNKAIILLWQAGEKRYVVGNGAIEAITANPKDEDEHLSRMGQMLDHKRIASMQKSLGANTDKCKQFGIPSRYQINKSMQRLLVQTGNE